MYSATCKLQTAIFQLIRRTAISVDDTTSECVVVYLAGIAGIPLYGVDCSVFDFLNNAHMIRFLHHLPNRKK